jgi:hypothetical protein
MRYVIAARLSEKLFAEAVPEAASAASATTRRARAMAGL